MLCAYDPPACGYAGADPASTDFAGAASTVEILAAKDPQPQYFAQIAYYRYSDGDLDGGKEAADRALAEASGKQREQLAKGLEELDKRAAKLASQRQKSAGEKGAPTPGAPGGNALSNPFGGLGSGAAPPGGPVPGG